MRHLLIAAVICVELILPLDAHRARAMNLYSYDLDSLVFMSDEIVRGKFAAPDNPDVPTAQRLIVSATFFGDVKPGDSLQVTGSELFFAPASNSPKIGEGVEVVVFIRRSIRVLPSEIPKTPVMYTLVPSGLKCVVDGRACGFRQHQNPGPYVMDAPAEKDLCPLIEDFEKQCTESISRTRPLVDRLSRRATKRDARWLLDVLRSRRDIPVGYDQRDAISEAACSRLAETKDLPTLDAALHLARGRGGFTALAGGFASQAGRTYLLRKLAEAKLPADQRQIYSSALGEPMWAYTQTPADGETCLERMAQLAVDFAKQGDEPSARTLIQHLRTAADVDEQRSRQRVHSPPSLERDLLAALNVLKLGYEEMTSANLKYEIDFVMLRARPGLGFQCAVGPITSVMTIPGPDRHYGPAPAGTIGLEYSYATSRELVGKSLEGVIVFEDLKTHESFLAPEKQEIKGGYSGGAERAATIPPNLPKARYRIFLRVKADGGGVSDGHGVEADLPLNAK